MSGPQVYRNSAEIRFVEQLELIQTSKTLGYYQGIEILETPEFYHVHPHELRFESDLRRRYNVISRNV